MGKHVDSRDSTQDMFGFEGVDALKNFEHIAEEELHRWPETLREMYDLLKHQLEQEGVDSKVAIKLLGGICENFGGMQFYLPRGHHLETMITHLSIWNEFTGDNVVQLSRKYEVSMQHVYRVIAKMRQREIKKHQPDLF